MHYFTERKCKFWDHNIETVDQLISLCLRHTPNEYKNRHDRESQSLYWKICHQYRLKKKTAENWHEHHSESVVVGADVSILWIIDTDRRLQANRPDIIIKERKE